MNGGLSSSPGLGPFSLSWRLESARGKPVVDVQRIVDVASLVSGASRSWRSELDKRIVLITEQTLSSCSTESAQTSITLPMSASIRSAQSWDSRFSFCHGVDRNRYGIGGERKVCVDASLEVGRSAFMTRLVRANGFFHYIDGTHRGEVAIGCRSIHMRAEHLLLATRRVPKRDALVKQILRTISTKRHVASKCASRIRTMYAHRTCLRASRSQALGGQ
jgi:hypothetical protein